MTVTTTRPEATGPGEPSGPRPATPTTGVRRLRLRARWLVPAVLGLWVAGWFVWRGQDTMALAGAETTPFHQWLNHVRDVFELSRNTNFFLEYVVGGISDALDSVVQFLQYTFSQPAPGRPVPEIGWVGVVAVFTWVGFAVAGLRSALLLAAGLLAFGYLGYWADSLDLLVVTAVAVGICVVVGLPLGTLMAHSRPLSAVVTPVLDLMQTVPAFAYLAPLVLVFGIGPASAVVVTVIYAIPPLVRVTEHAIRTVDQSAMEASRSLGATPFQRLRTTQLPMAKRTIIVGLNQTIMAALAMATIAALVDGPGLGQPVVEALQTLDVGSMFVSGLAIVLMAIVLDRTTTAASGRSELLTRAGDRSRRLRRGLLLAGAVAATAAVYYSRTYVAAAKFPSSPDLGGPLASWAGTATHSVVAAIAGATTAVKNLVSYGLLNPLQSLLALSPWWLAAAALLAIAVVVGGRRGGAVTLVCEGVIIGSGLWNEAMVTLATTLVATLVVMTLAAVLGVWMGRRRRVDTVLRPLLDAAQTIPPFVYLVPALALFSVGRFTAIVAAVVYAVPVAIKLVADGIHGVDAETVEAAESTGSSSWQTIRKVQVPMARSAMTLAANQGLIYVLSMVVIGGLVGGGGLGFLVVRGFSQMDLFGKGLAAGIAITALGVMLDRVTQYAAAGRVR